MITVVWKELRENARWASLGFAAMADGESELGGLGPGADIRATATALGRLGRPDDVARCFRALALELTHVTGQVMVVDGGQMVVRSQGDSGGRVARP